MKKPEYRQDLVTGRWVIIAADRADRPIEFRSPAIRDTDRKCPFCVGNESLTPDSSLELLDDVSGDWRVRFVPNLYPAFDACNDVPDASRASTDQLSLDDDRRNMPAFGLHEVVIESPKHLSSLTELTDVEAKFVVEAYRSRLHTLSDKTDITHAMIFKNCGPAAGISLEHVHSQLVALPIVPPVVEHELLGAQKWATKHDGCVYCHLIDRASGRVVDSTADFVAICPFASRFAYEVWILPNRHSSHFHHSHNDHGLATFLCRTLARLESLIPGVAYNVILHTSPFDSNRYDYYHWHIEIIPRIATVAGLEWGSGLHVNVVPPEIAARRLSQVG